MQEPSPARKSASLKQPADCLSPRRVHLSLSPSCTPSYVPYPAKHTRRVGERELSEAPKLPSPTLPSQTVPCSSSGLEDNTANTVAASLQTEGLAVSPANLVHVLLPTLLSKRPRPKSFCGSVSTLERAFYIASLDACSRGLQPSFLFPAKHACRVRPASVPCCPVKDSPSLYLRQGPSSAPPCSVEDSTPAPPVCFFNESISKENGSPCRARSQRMLHEMNCTALCTQTNSKIPGCLLNAIRDEVWEQCYEL